MADGKQLTLSQIQKENKIVWIDFWASWCKPCRELHPGLRWLYHHYKDKKIGEADGFTVYSVSIDDKKTSWLKAIEKDTLDWPNHVIDTKGMGSEYTGIYQFEQIPTGYLLDENGIIIGKNISQKWLEYELRRRMGKE